MSSSIPVISHVVTSDHYFLILNANGGFIGIEKPCMSCPVLALSLDVIKLKIQLIGVK